MRLPIVVLALAAACAAAAAGWSALRRADAQEQTGTPGTLHVSGMRIDGRKARAIVRFVNTSPNAADVYMVHYTVQAPDGNALSLPAAGADGAALYAGKTLELDLGEIVTAYRAERGFGPYSGPVRLLAYGETGAYTVFGPTTVHASAVQTEGAARFEPLVEWR